MKPLNEVLRLIRVYHDLSQSEAADALGISKSYLSEIEKGEKNPTLQLIDKYHIKFKIPKSSILFFAEGFEGVGEPTRIQKEIAGKILTFLSRAVGDEHGTQSAD